MTPLGSIPQATMATITAGNNLLATLERQLHSYSAGFLTNIQMTEAVDRIQSLDLTRFLLEAVDASTSTGAPSGNEPSDLT
jgi:hypothetical protein